jgi:hypothetical protein
MIFVVVIPFPNSLFAKSLLIPLSRQRITPALFNLKPLQLCH